MRASRVLHGVLGCAVVAAVGGCSSLPPLDQRTPSTALSGTESTRLGTAAGKLTATHPGYSGFYPLVNGRDAFAARALLARAAERSLDVQYYIWNPDITGNLMFNALRDAANRGVRVRLLLDDNHTGPIEQVLLALDAHPAIEVRVFNPFAIRKPRILGLLTDFPRLNRRMHNKSFTADNQVSIVGGRNIGDEYFDAGQDLLFVDLDVMAIGPVVRDISRAFDRYWNSASAYPVSSLVPHFPGEPGPMPAPLPEPNEAQAYRDAVNRSLFVDQLMRSELPIEWAATRLLSDVPEKVLGKAQRQDTVAPQLRALFGQPRRDLNLVSPYFVPGQSAENLFAALAGRGVKVNILTNSLGATDVPVLHAGYVKWRKALLAAGVTLYEMRGAGGERERSGSAPAFGSSANALHAKTFAVDDERIFVGSFNLDQRSVALNTELGLVIESEPLARRLSTALRENMPQRAYEVRLGPDGKLYWLERRGGSLVRYDTDPGASLWRRTYVRMLSWLPIDWLL